MRIRTDEDAIVWFVQEGRASEVANEFRRLGWVIDSLQESNENYKSRHERSVDQYNGIIDTQLKVIEELKEEVERKQRIINAGYDKICRLENIIAKMSGTIPEHTKYVNIAVDFYAESSHRLPSSYKTFVQVHPELNDTNNI